MKTLSYRPRIEAYVAVDGNGSVSYYDLTEDIVSGSVTRNQDAVSTFSLTLSNKNGKYNGLFTPMDRVIIYLSKVQRHQVLAGYITSTSAWTLYPQDFKMSGKCSMYRLQRLYWDPGLVASHTEFADAVFGMNEWGGYGDLVKRMLTGVGGVPSNRISIGDIPNEVIDWAYGLYAAKIEDMGQARDMANAFYDMLRSAGPKIGGGVVSGGSPALNSSDIQGVWEYLRKCGFSEVATAAIMGTWTEESGIDPTSIEGIYDERYTLGPKKKAAMADWEGYTINTLFPMYAGRLSINREAYKGRDGKYYPGIGLAGYTGPRVNDLFDYANAHNLDWYTYEANIGLFESELSSRYAALLENDFMNATDLPWAVNKFVLVYEMPGGIPAQWLANRINSAQKVLSEYGGK